MDEEKLITKRTFEDVLNAQEELRDTLESLVKENRCLIPEEKSLFMRQLAHATMGLGREHDFLLKICDWYDVECLGNVEHWARQLAMKNKNYSIFKRPDPNNMGETQKDYEVPISKLWDALLYGFFDVFPLALDRASSMSKEHDNTGGGEPYEFRPKK